MTSEIEKISAVTFRVVNMTESVRFYKDVLGMELLYGGESTGFSSLRYAADSRERQAITLVETLKPRLYADRPVTLGGLLERESERPCALLPGARDL